MGRVILLVVIIAVILGAVAMVTGCEPLGSYDRGYKQGLKIGNIPKPFSYPFMDSSRFICIKNLGLGSVYVNGDYELKSGSLYTSIKNEMIITREAQCPE